MKKLSLLAVVMALSVTACGTQTSDLVLNPDIQNTSILNSPTEKLPSQFKKSSSEKFTNYLLKRTEQTFAVLDKNRDGFIDVDEYMYLGGAEEYGPAFETLKKMDENNDSKISLIEAKKYSTTFLGTDSSENYMNFYLKMTEKVFSTLDRNRDGFLDLNEYMFLSKYKEILRSSFGEMDENKDRKISLNEAKKFSVTFLGTSNISTLDYELGMTKNVTSFFNKTDVNKDGYIDKKDELNIFITESYVFKDKPALVNSQFNISDKNKDNKLTYTEFEDLYHTLHIINMPQ
jgi:Ca2+-binding EF-hand superfamily protein